MSKSLKTLLVGLILLLAQQHATDALAWSLKTHVFIARMAGMEHPECATIPDLSKKENESFLVPFHRHDAAPDTVVTPEYINRYRVTEGKYVPVGQPKANPIDIKVPHPAGVLYWKIVDLYEKMNGKPDGEYEYYLFMIAHLIGNLSQPLHNFPYSDSPAGDGKVYAEVGAWAKKNHPAFDEALDQYLPLNPEMQKKLEFSLIPITIKSADDLAREICDIANASITLAFRCYMDKRIMTKDEALQQCALSISLLKAIIESDQELP